MVKDHDGMRLIALMRRAGITDAQLAAATETSVQAVGKWKRKGTIARRQIPLICRALHASSDELLGLKSLDGDPVHYEAALDRDRLAEAIAIVARQVPQNHHNRDPRGRADIIVSVYEYLQHENSVASAERLVKGMLRVLSARQEAAEPSTGEANERGRETAR